VQYLEKGLGTVRKVRYVLGQGGERSREAKKRSCIKNWKKHNQWRGGDPKVSYLACKVINGQPL